MPDTKKTDVTSDRETAEFLEYASKMAKVGFREQALGMDHPSTQEALAELRAYPRPHD